MQRCSKAAASLARRLRPGSGIGLLLVLLGFPSYANSQNDVAYLDGDGRWQVTAAAQPAVYSSKNANAGTWQIGAFTIEYEDVGLGTGIGFDDPQLGETRRQTLHDVLAYAASLLDESGSADVLVSSSQYDASGPLAVAGPYVQMEIGFQSGYVWQHLKTGVDPSADSQDAVLTVDFGYQWNDDGDATTPDEYDLFTVLLHELTHALGMFSVVASDGRSLLLNSGDAGLFSIADDLLVLGASGKDLYLPGGEINASSVDLESGDVAFGGALASAAFGEPVPLFAPSPFKQGTSLTHWDVVETDAVLLPTLARGVEKRSYLPWELRALGDLGYQIVRCGDGALDAEEECDDGNREQADACLNSCELAACGDGVVQTGVEECDDGASNSDIDLDACRTACLAPHCGDSVVDSDEECDDGNGTDGDGCSAFCEVEREPVPDAGTHEGLAPEREGTPPPGGDAGVPAKPTEPETTAGAAGETPDAGLTTAPSCDASAGPSTTSLRQGLLLLFAALFAARFRLAQLTGTFVSRITARSTRQATSAYGPERDRAVNSPEEVEQVVRLRPCDLRPDRGLKAPHK